MINTVCCSATWCSVLWGLLSVGFSDDEFVHIGSLSGGTSMSVDRNDAQTILLARSGVAWPGIYRTTDGGAQWFLTSAIDPDPALFIAHAVGSSTRVYAASESGVFASDDGGATFSPMAAGFGELIGLRTTSDPDVVMVWEKQAAYRSEDGGATFSTVWSGDVILDLEIAPSDPQRIYIGLDLDEGLIRSDDGGASFAATSDVTGPLGWDGYDVAVHPGDPDRLLLIARVVFGSAHPVYSSVDGGDSWLEEIADADGDLIWSYDGSAAHVIERVDTGRLWSRDGSTGTWSSTLVPMLEATDHESLTSTAAGDLAVLQSGGPSPVRGTVASGFVSIGIPCCETDDVLPLVGTDRLVLKKGLSAESLVPGQVDSSMGHSGGRQLARGRDGRWFAVSWAPFSAYVRAYQGKSIVKFKTFASGPELEHVVVSSLPPHAVLGIGTGGGYRSVDDGVTWSTIDGLAGITPETLAFDPFTPGRVVMIDVFRRVIESLDDGASFAPPQPAWPGLGFPEWLVFDPVVPGRMWRHLELAGLWKSDDFGATWVPQPALGGGATQDVWLDPVGRDVAVVVAQGELLLTDDGMQSFETIPFGAELGLPTTGALSFDVDPDDGSAYVGTADRGAWRLPAGTAPHFDLGGQAVGSAGIEPRLFGIGLPDVGSTWGLGLAHALGGTPGVLLVGTDVIAQPLWGGSFVVGGQVFLAIDLVTDGGPGAAGVGDFELQATIPNDPLLIGTSLVAQVALIDPGAPSGSERVLSNGLHATIR